MRDGFRDVRQSSPKLAVLELARAQHGVFHLDQATAVGMSRKQVYRLVSTGEWTLLLPKVFATFGTGAEWRRRVMAACLWGGAEVAASHRTAAAIWQLDGIKSPVAELSTRGRKQPPREWMLIHEASSRFAVQRRDGIPVTTVARTLLDLGGTVPATAVEIAMEDALRRGLTTVARLRQTLTEEGGRGRPGTATLARLLDERSPRRRPTESELERRVLRVLADGGFSPPVCQFVVNGPDGFVARLDFAYPQALIGIEADGYRWHSGKDRWRRDRARSNELVRLGWRVLHVTWEDVTAGGVDLIRSLRPMLGQTRLLP